MSISHGALRPGENLIRAAGFTALPSRRGAVVSSCFLGDERSEFSALPKARGALPNGGSNGEVQERRSLPGQVSKGGETSFAV